MVNADALVVKLNSGEYKTIHLSSIRPPRNEGEVGADLRLSACRQLCTRWGPDSVGEPVASHGRPVN